MDERSPRKLSSCALFLSTNTCQRDIINGPLVDDQVCRFLGLESSALRQACNYIGDVAGLLLLGADFKYRCDWKREFMKGI